jgi:leader peptidase (prepilin peptidase) / N-methyltransferase
MFDSRFTPLLILMLLVALGWLAGGLANLAADVLPRHARNREQEAGGPPCVEASKHCGSPFHSLTLPWYWLRAGACPRCGSHCPIRAPLLEIANALAFPLIWSRLSDQPFYAALVCMYTTFLLTVFVIDLEHRLVLNIMVAPAAVTAMAASLVPGGPSPSQALLGGLLAFAAFLVLAIAGRGALGFGDVKLAGLIGIMVGYPVVVSALVLGIVLGGLGALALIGTRKAGRKTAIAYAPYLVAGALIAIVARGPI